MVKSVSGTIKTGIKILIKFLKLIFTHKKACCKVVILMFNILTYNASYGQQIITLQTVLDSSIKNSPALRGSSVLITQQQHLLKSSINLPNPEILIQNPSGKFYTLGVQQIIDFPTVYGTQRKIQKENIKLAETSQKFTLNDVKYQIHILYSELQYQFQLMLLWQKQDSSYRIIADNADKAFKAGTIDFVQASFSRIQAGQVKTNYNLAKANYNGNLQNIKTLSGIEIDFIPDTLTSFSNQIFISQTDTSINQNYSLVYSRQQIAINEKRLQLEKQKALPGFTVAFLNQGDKNTLNQNRFYAGLRIPLWFWQYKGNIAAARDQIEISKYNTDANSLKLTAEMQSAYIKYIANLEALTYYNSEILIQTDALTSASNRFFTSGNSSYTDYLRYLNEANQIKKNYWETLKNYNQTLIYILYLNGTL